MFYSFHHENLFHHVSNKYFIPFNANINGIVLTSFSHCVSGDKETQLISKKKPNFYVFTLYAANLIFLIVLWNIQGFLCINI